MHPQGVIWFASVPQLERLIRNELAAHTDLERVVIDLGAVGRLDYTGAAALSRFVNEVRSAGTTVAMVNVRPGARRAIAAHRAEFGDC